MKLILTLVGVVLLIIAGIYFLMPADQLPGFFRGMRRAWRASTASMARSPPSSASC